MSDESLKPTGSSKVSGAPLAEAVVALLKLDAVEIDTNRLLAGLPIVDQTLPEDQLERAVGRLGYHASVTESAALKDIEFPCCVALKNGEYACVVSRTGDKYHFLESDNPDAYRLVSEQAFADDYAGRWLRLSPSVDRLLERHSVRAQEAHWFWGRVFFKGSRVVDITVSSLLANILAVVTSLFALQVYDRVIPGEAEATLWVLAVGVGFAILFEAILRLSRARLVDEVGKEAEIEISDDVFHHVVDMKLDKRPTTPAGIVHMVREFGAVKEFFTLAAVGVVTDLPFVLIFLALIYGIAGHVVWIVVAGAIFTVIPSILMQEKMARLSREALGGMSSASRVVTEAVYGLETVKASRSEPYFQKQWQEIIALNASKTTEQRALSALQTYWGTSVQQVTYVSALIAGVYMVFEGELTLGAIIAVSILLTRTLSPIGQLSQLLSRWQNMKVALDGLSEIMNSAQERDPDRNYFKRSRLQGSIQLRKVQYAHPNSERAALEVEALKIAPGTRLALLGSNGSGKSTFLRVLAGLYTASEGELLIDGLDIRQIDPADLRRNIGYLPQEVRLFRGTLRDNLMTANRNSTDDDMMQALAFSGLGEFVKRHPEGLDLEVADGGEGLSIGQKQSVGLARLYLQDPAIILLDEPTAALDQTLESALVGRLGKWIGKRTCIVATHRLEILSHMTRIAVLQNGKLAVEGERDAVLKRLAPNSKEGA